MANKLGDIFLLFASLYIFSIYNTFFFNVLFSCNNYAYNNVNNLINMFVNYNTNGYIIDNDSNFYILLNNNIFYYNLFNSNLNLI